MAVYVRVGLDITVLLIFSVLTHGAFGQVTCLTEYQGLLTSTNNIPYEEVPKEKGYAIERFVCPVPAHSTSVAHILHVAQSGKDGEIWTQLHGNHLSSVSEHQKKGCLC
eukprot:CAMPEP_0181203096 /NCGR_PEP_ID=MMETSP1096-20121128/19201_1 /TAXON_ID=156174 ORGANISM="Chrysochromulina ericina, Strain CCMP281" /NCGR_SAMPLE_ID=MMETSP1096 /ASSEMBLY_ACC=CAM_ASM_000453 /LENGTH=108 /DNA_ID=CAMNT_0023293669 /DNA_START=21 /DNA_END=347 /DNA_ORIENTATION=-